MLQGHRYFECTPHKGHFSLLKNCKKDSRFSDSSHLIANDPIALNSKYRIRYSATKNVYLMRSII